VASVKLQCVSKWFARRDGDSLHVLQNVDLDVPEKSITAIVGASGSGKSTLLNIIAGLVKPDRGCVFLNGVKASAFTEWRSMTYMFQDDRLLPWRTAARNVALGLEAQGVKRAERKRRVAETLALVGLDQFANAYPHELSGGMRSRVALARSLVTRPTMMLMDEPFSKLDPTIRSQMHAEVLRIAELMSMTIVFVTHDVEEAVVLANQIVVLNPRPGRVRETRSIDLPYPRDPSTPAVHEQARSLRASL
jgi:NitT/TauT family transport system ATP-binding protein